MYEQGQVLHELNDPRRCAQVIGVATINRVPLVLLRQGDVFYSLTHKQVEDRFILEG